MPAQDTADNQSAQDRTDQRLPLGKKIVFTGFLVLLPVLFLLLLEGLLTLLNYGGELDLFIRQKSGETEQYTLNPNVTRRYFFQKGVKTPIPITQTFSAEKDSNIYRIFCLGASTTQGFPYQPNAAFPADLKNILTGLFPHKKIEVVNCGITALSSHAVLDLGREIVRKYHPDLLVVYSGHNEFYGVFGQSSRLPVMGNRFVMQQFFRLQRSHLFLLVRDVINKIAGPNMARNQTEPTPTLMGFMARDIGIEFGGKTFNRAAENYRANITDLVEAAKKSGTDIMLCNLVDNQRDFPPFASKHGASLSPQDSLAWAETMNAAAKQQTTGDIQSAVELYKKTLAVDSTFAAAHFQLAVCYDSLQDYTSAKNHYRLAKDYDVIRFRAPSVFNTILADICRAQNVPLVDVASYFAGLSEGGLVGQNLIHEHVHPNQRGYFCIAKAIAEKMTEAGLLEKNWPWAASLSDSAYMAMSHLTDLDREVVNYAIFRLISQWPFPPEIRPEKYQRVGTPETERIAVRLVDFNEGNLVQYHLEYGNSFHQQNQFEEAEAEYLAAHAIQPTPETYDHLGRLYLRQTEIAYRDLRDYELAARGFAKGVEILQEGLQLWPDDVTMSFNLGLLFFMRNDKTAEALASFNNVLRLNPAHQKALAQVGELLIRQGEMAKAREHLLAAAARYPQDGHLCTLLAFAYLQEKNNGEGLKWLQKGASLGDKRAQVMLQQAR